MKGSNPKRSITFQIYQQGALKGEHTLTQEVIKVGTLSSAHLQLDDPKVSRMHAYIQVDSGGQVYVSDLGSARGTQVNGQRVNKAQLNDGDRLRLGNTDLVVAIADVAAATAAVPVPAAMPAAPTMAPRPAVTRTSSFQPTELSAEDLERLEHTDGSRSVEVVALYQDAPHVVKHYSNPKAGKVRTGSLVAMVVGLCLAVGGAVAFGSQIYSVKRQESHQAKIKEFIAERGLPQKFVPKVRTNRTAELAGASGFALGLFWMLFGMLRTREDLRKPRFTVGEHPQCTFHTPTDALPPGLAEFPLVHTADGAFQLAYTPKMDGTVELPDGSTLTLQQAAEQGLARPSSEVEGAYQIPITEGLRANLRMGDTSFVINTVASAKGVAGDLPAAVAGAATQPISLATLGSGAVVGLFLLLFSFRPAEAGAFDTDSVESNKITRMVRSEMRNAQKEPEQKPPKDDIKPKPNPNDNSKFKGPKGSDDDRMSRRRGSGPVTPSTGASRRSVGRSMGMAGVFQSMSKKLGSMFSLNAVSSDAEDALGALVGNTVGDPAGLDGLGLNSAGGRSGNPGGAGVEGFGGWRIGKGEGGGFDGPGGGLRFPGTGTPVGPYKPKGPIMWTTKVTTEGGLDARTIKRVIRRHLNQVKYCYMTYGLPSNDRLAGMYKVAFTIRSNGKVGSVRTAQSTLNHSATEACIRGMVRTWRFPKPEGSMPYVVYPFHFKPSGR